MRDAARTDRSQHESELELEPKPHLISRSETPPRDRRLAQRDAIAQLHRALERDEFELQYQPIHDVADGRVVSAEALLRWRDGGAGKFGIEQLTSAAERGKEVFGLAEWVAEKMIADMQRWPECDPLVRVNFNLSARQIQERDPVKFFERFVSEGKLEPKHVNLEITEKSFIRKPRHIVGMLEKLKNLGFGLWLDDFGTGHSSIEHLRYFPVDGLKIPSAYVAEMLHDDRSEAIVHAMISVAKALDIQVVAEGVESEEQLDVLKKHGCDEVQGFVFSGPVCADDFIAYVERVNLK